MCVIQEKIETKIHTAQTAVADAKESTGDVVEQAKVLLQDW